MLNIHLLPSLRKISIGSAFSPRLKFMKQFHPLCPLERIYVAKIAIGISTEHSILNLHMDYYTGIYLYK
jgi:hypothetical protein